MRNVAIRLADHADIERLVALVTSAYRGDASRAGWTTEADLLEGSRVDAGLIEADLVRDRSEILIAVGGERLLGCVHVEERGGRGYLGMFAVDPALQGSGLGKRLMEAGEAHAATAWGVREMEMTVISLRVDLIAFYSRRGYRPVGDTAPFPYGDARFGTPLRDDLVMEVLRKPLPARG